MTRRIITGVTGAVVLILVCFFSGTVVWPLAVTFFSFIGVEEMLRCTHVNRDLKFALPARIFSCLPMISYVFCRYIPGMDPFRCIFLFSVLFFFSELVIAVFNHNFFPTEKLYSLIALVLYVAISFTAVSQIRYLDSGLQEGKYLYFLIFLGAWISDTFAYFAGHFFGKTKLAPHISPKKTVEGSIGGILGNILAFAGYAWMLRSVFDLNANVFFFALLGALFSCVGQFGDLFASGIKRHYKIKDYGSLFPGHGGVLDRFDSVLAIASFMLLAYAAFGFAFLIR